MAGDARCARVTRVARKMVNVRDAWRPSARDPKTQSPAKLGPTQWETRGALIYFGREDESRKTKRPVFRALPRTTPPPKERLWGVGGRALHEREGRFQGRRLQIGEIVISDTNYYCTRAFTGFTFVGTRAWYVFQ